MFESFKLRKRIQELEEKLERTEYLFKKLEVEWTETYDKFRQLHWRVAKRVKQLEQAPGEEPENVAEGGAAIHAVPPTDAAPLTARQMQLQAQILSRRKGA